MTVKVQMVNGGSDSVDFVNAAGTTLAQVKGYDDTSSNGHLEFYTTASGTSTERVRVDSAGNVGIGTGSPNSAGVGKAVTINGASDSILELNYGGTRGGYLFSNATNLVLSAVNSGFLKFNTGDTERARIDSSGNLLVNGTNVLQSNGRVTVNNPAGSAYGFCTGYSSTAGQYRLVYLWSADNSYRFDNGSNYAYLSSAGAWTNASDARLKNSIVEIKYGLADVLKTQPRSYKMNEVAGDYIGFIAQEMQTVIPEVVSGDPEKQLGVDYGSLVAVAFKAIQEQQAIINAQDSVLKQLTERITALENKQ